MEQVKDWSCIAKKANFNVQKMAASCSVTPRTLERFFLLTFQRGPKVWAREHRIELALSLIKKGWMKKAVAQELGFVNSAHLWHELKALHKAPQ